MRFRVKNIPKDMLIPDEKARAGELLAALGASADLKGGAAGAREERKNQKKNQVQPEGIVPHAGSPSHSTKADAMAVFENIERNGNFTNIRFPETDTKIQNNSSSTNFHYDFASNNISDNFTVDSPGSRIPYYYP
jgi:hypothetical protein